MVSGSTTAGRRHVGFQDGNERGLGRVDPFDVRLEDTDLLDEVELTANLIVAANQSTEHMTVAEIDRILGVVPPPRAGD
jgi:hypothetical protein